LLDAITQQRVPDRAATRPLLSSLRRRTDLLISAAAVLLVAAPLLFTSSGFGLDFTNHLWLSWVQGEAIAHSGYPSYFLNAHGLGVFYPFFAFYGGTLYTLVGGISDLLGGQPVAAYVIAITLAIAGTYGGVLWLARQLGLRGPLAHAPALTVVTSAYYITNLYGRGAWTEFMAVAAIPPLLAGGLWLARAPAWRVGPVIVFVVSAVVFSGSHNITLLWGTTVTVVAAVALWLALGTPALHLRRLAMLAGLGVTGLAVNAWFLLPDVSYAQKVFAHLAVSSNGAFATFFDTPQVLLDPLRHVPRQSTTPALFVQAPVWFVAWGLLAGSALLWRRSSTKPLRRAWLALLVVLGVLLAMIMVTPIWRAIPFPFDEIQFPYRLNSYVFYATAGLVLVSALALQRAAAAGQAPRAGSWLRCTLAGACAVSVGLCVWQQWVPNTLFPERSYTNRAQALASVNTPPNTWYDPISYRDVQAPVVAVPAGRTLTIPPASVHGDRFAALMNVPPGPAPIQTNIAAGPYLVHISGLRRIGRSAEGLAVVRREGSGSGPVHVVLEVAHGAPIVVGWILSLLAVLVLVAVIAWTSARGYRARRAARARRPEWRARPG